MKLHALEKSVGEHAGEFLCEQINDEKNTMVVRFRHVITAASAATDDLPPIGRLRDFYDTFGSVLFYYDEISGDAGKYIAPPSEWPELHNYFNAWIKGLSEDELSEVVPEWVATCLVIGETPQSGNYILIATQGMIAGHIFEFDHDGFEFIHKANDIVEYVENLLMPDGAKLTEIASHMRFIAGDSSRQWWILHLRDNRGHLATTTEQR